MKINQLKMIIREVVREEIRLGLKEIVGEINQPTQETKPVFEKKNYSKNSVLNDVLNETAQDGDWKTLGGKKFTSERMNELVGGAYGDLMNNSKDNTDGSLAREMGLNPEDPSAAFLKKDYRKLMKAVDKKAKQKRG